MTAPAFRFGQARFGDFCCAKPVGCTATHAGCSFLNSPWKRADRGEPGASCQAGSVEDDEAANTRRWMRCTLPAGHQGEHPVRVVKTTVIT